MARIEGSCRVQVEGTCDVIFCDLPNPHAQVWGSALRLSGVADLVFQLWSRDLGGAVG